VTVAREQESAVIVTGTLRRVRRGTFTVGIIGGGQLARMMHAASIGLGINVRLLAEGPDTAAAQVVHDVTVGDYTDPATVRSFAAECDVVTFDHEHVPTGLLRDLESAGVAVRPGPALDCLGGSMSCQLRGG
jgi:5-(carboxyamino)imidazole ribonucleotide synthase